MLVERHFTLSGSARKVALARYSSSKQGKSVMLSPNRQIATLITLLPALFVSACGSRQPEQRDAQPTAASTQASREPSLAPPRHPEFAAAWSRACPDQEAVGKALCKSNGLADANFTCDFALGDGEYRRHTAELEPGNGRWDLANPDLACEIG